MVQNRTGRHDLKLNMIINYAKQLGRSLVLLAHYTTVFVCFVSRSVNCFLEVIKWISVFARYTVAVFDSIHRSLHWWTRSHRRTSIEMLSSSETESDWWRTLSAYELKENVPGKKLFMDLKWIYKENNINASVHVEVCNVSVLLELYVAVLSFCSFQGARCKHWGLEVMEESTTVITTPDRLETEHNTCFSGLNQYSTGRKQWRIFFITYPFNVD